MKPPASGNILFQNYAATLACVLLVAAFLLALSPCGRAAFIAPGGGGTNSSPTYTPLNSWSFNDTNFWTSDNGCAPLSFTNLTSTYMGDGTDLVLDSPGNPAWLQFAVTNASGASNVTVDVGSVTFWYAPYWSSTNMGGSGPSEFARLLEMGGYTPDSSFGWWSLYVDDVGANLYFSAQTNDFSSNVCTYVTAPIAWTTNYWHFIAFTYSTTNTALYVDGTLAASGPALTNYPGANALANGFFIGSDSNGVLQAEGMIDDLDTYNVPLDADTIAETYQMLLIEYLLNPFNRPEITSASSSQTTYTPIGNVINGIGNLQWVGQDTTNCVDGATTNTVWITNVLAWVAGNGNMNLEFTIEGGYPDIPYDVFVNSELAFGPNDIWAWEGQGYQCNTYLLTNMPNTACFLILGTPLDSTGDGLTDAYKELVAKANPSLYSTDGTGMADGWEVLYFGHINVAPDGDPDGDGLTTFQEWLMNSKGYNPVKWNSFTNSVVGDGFQNYSGDGLANLMQASFGGNLLTNNPAWKWDTDGDGLPDEYKVMVNVSTNSPPSAPGLPTNYSQNPVP